MWALFWNAFWYALLYVLSSFAIILTRKRELFALLLLSVGCQVTVNILWLFLTVPLVGLQCVIMVFPDHTHFLFNSFLLSQRYSLMCGIVTNVHLLMSEMRIPVDKSLDLQTFSAYK